MHSQTIMYEVLSVAPDLVLPKVNVSPADIERAKAEYKKQILARMPWIDLGEWMRFEEKNPDANNWTPCPLIGIEALHNRVQLQAKNTAEQLNMLDSNKNADWLASAAAEIRLMDERTENCKRTHSMLSHRLIGVLGRLERLQTRVGARRGPRTSAEINFHERLEKIKTAIENPRGCKAKLYEVESRIENIAVVQNGLAAAQDQASANGSSSSVAIVRATNGGGESVEQERKREQALLAFVESQRQKIEKLMDIVRRDARDVQVMRAKMMAVRG